MLTVIFMLKNFGGTTAGKRVVIDFWGVFDPRSSFESVVQAYQKLNPNVRINYQMLSYEDYEKKMVDELAAGAGPDVLMIQNSWLPKHGPKLTPLPQKIEGQELPLMTFKQFQDTYVDVAVKDFTRKNQIYAIPLYVDTLALFYNKDMLNTAGITHPPQNWEEFNEDVRLLTKYDEAGNIIRAGAAIGTAKNINRSTDILMALMLQAGVKMTDDNNSSATFTKPVNSEPLGLNTLEYYTSFANNKSTVYTWNDDLHYSMDAFVQGEVAMMFNYSHQILNLKSKASRLNYGIAPMPQMNNLDIRNYANYWGLGVSNRSDAKEEAWKFIVYLTSRENIIPYLNATLRPAARRDIIEQQKNDFTYGLFANQALTARSWYQVDPVAIEEIFADAIDDVNYKKLSLRESLRNAETRTNVLMVTDSDWR